MKKVKNMKIYIGLCVVLSLTLVLCVLAIIGILNDPQNKIDYIDSGVSQTFEEYTSGVLNQFETESDTPKHSESHTSSKYSYIDNSSQSTISIHSPSEVLESATSSNSTTSISSSQTSTPSSIPTTPSGEEIDEGEKAEFIRLYNKAEKQYINEIVATNNVYEQQIKYWRDTASNAYATKRKEESLLAEQMAEKGMLNSGYHKQKLKEIEDNYKAKQAECQKKIDELNKKIEEAKQLQANPNPYTIMGIIVEISGMSYDEVAAKYIKYIE